MQIVHRASFVSSTSCATIDTPHSGLVVRDGGSGDIKKAAEGADAKGERVIARGEHILWCLRAIMYIVSLICFYLICLSDFYCSTTHATATHPDQPETPPCDAAGESHSLDATLVLRRRLAQYFSSRAIRPQRQVAAPFSPVRLDSKRHVQLPAPRRDARGASCDRILTTHKNGQMVDLDACWY